MSRRMTQSSDHEAFINTICSATTRAAFYTLNILWQVLSFDSHTLADGPMSTALESLGISLIHSMMERLDCTIHSRWHKKGYSKKYSSNHFPYTLVHTRNNLVERKKDTSPIFFPKRVAHPHFLFWTFVLVLFIARKSDWAWKANQRTRFGLIIWMILATSIVMIKGET